MYKTKRRLRPWFKMALALVLILGVAGGGGLIYRHFFMRNALTISQNTDIPDFVQQQYLSARSSRNHRPLKQVRAVVIHYVGNPGTTAAQNRGYFNKPSTEVNSHFIVGLSGEILQCVPLTEQSCASNNRNADTVSIETCHPDESGAFNEETYQALVKLTSWLCSVYHLDTDAVIRHYDITGKQCPKYFVEHPESWKQFKLDVQKALKKSI